MRLLHRLPDGKLTLTTVDGDNAPPYAILSHTWTDGQEVTYQELIDGTGKDKTGYDKILFCIDQAASDDLEYAWVDTCCINKSKSDEVSYAINSMFRWYQRAAKCYVYLTDVKVPPGVTVPQDFQVTWDHAFRHSRWFTRGWTLQELLAPATVDFYSAEKKWLGSKITLEREIQEITKLPLQALRKPRLGDIDVNERMTWAAKRTTTKKEDRAYCLFGIFDVCLPIIYGEGEERAMRRLRDEALRHLQGTTETHPDLTIPYQRNVRAKRSSLTAQVMNEPTQALQHTDFKRKRAVEIGGEMSRTTQADAVRTAIEKLQTLSNYMQSQSQDKAARKLVRRLGVVLDATKQLGCPQSGQQRNQRNAITDSMVHWRRISVNSGVPRIKPSEGSQIDRKSNHFTIDQWNISLKTTEVRSYDGNGYEVIQSLSSLHLQPCCSGTGSPIAVFFGEQVNLLSTSIIHPVILAYRSIPRSSEVFQVVETDDLEGLKKLIVEQKATTRDCDERGRSLLTYACYYASPKCCKFLIESGADVNRFDISLHGQDELVDASKTLVPLNAWRYYDRLDADDGELIKALQCREYLLEADADPTVHSGSSPPAICRASISITRHEISTRYFKMLIRHSKAFIDFNLPVFGSFSLWLYVCLCASVVGAPKQALAQLLNAGCDANEIDDLGRNGLFYCVRYAIDPNSSRSFEALRYLLRLPIDIHALDDLGRTISDHVNNDYDDGYKSYQQDLWYCALKREGFDVPCHSRIAEYNAVYTPRHYYALQNLDSWSLWSREEREAFDKEFTLTVEEYRILARIEGTTYGDVVDIESSSSLDDEMENRVQDVDDDSEDEGDEGDDRYYAEEDDVGAMTQNIDSDDEDDFEDQWMAKFVESGGNRSDMESKI